MTSTANARYPRVPMAVRYLHERRRIPYTRIAQALGLSTSTLRNHLKGRTAWRIDTLTRLSELVGKPLPWLLSNDDGGGSCVQEE